MLCSTLLKSLVKSLLMPKYKDAFGAISILFVIMISIADVQPVVTMLASLVAIISGIFAIRYYFYATNNIKK